MSHCRLYMHILRNRQIFSLMFWNLLSFSSETGLSEEYFCIACVLHLLWREVTFAQRFGLLQCMAKGLHAEDRKSVV